LCAVSDTFGAYRISINTYRKSTFQEHYLPEDFPIVVSPHGWVFSEVVLSSDKADVRLGLVDCYLRRTGRGRIGDDEADILLLDSS